MHPLIERLAAELAPIVPAEPVEVSGAWSTTRRRTYASATQLGSGEGPFVEVVDVRWQGTLACAVPLAGYLFMITSDEASWVKSSPPTIDPVLHASMHAYADRRVDRASF